MAANTRVQINATLLFDGWKYSKESLSQLARQTNLSPRVIADMMRAHELPGRGFYSEGVRAVCAALGKPPEQVIVGKRQRKSSAAGGSMPIPALTTAPPTGLATAVQVPATVTMSVVVPADTCIDDALDLKSLLVLAPGCAVELLAVNASSRWTHDPSASVEQAIAGGALVFPECNTQGLLSAEQVREACSRLEVMARQAVIAWLGSYGLQPVRELALRQLPLTLLIEQACDLLSRLKRRFAPAWRQVPGYVERLQRDLRRSFRPVNILVQSGATPGADLLLWRAAITAGHMARLAAGDRNAWKALGPWYDASGESALPAGEGYPLPTAPVGASILYIGSIEPSPGDHTARLLVDSIHRFNTPADRVTNATTETRYGCIACNDPLPGDNLGKVKLRIAIHPPPDEPGN